MVSDPLHRRPSIAQGPWLWARRWLDGVLARWPKVFATLSSSFVIFSLSASLVTGDLWPTVPRH